MKPQTIRTLSSTTRFHFSSKQHCKIAEACDQNVTINLKNEVFSSESSALRESDENELSRLLEDCEVNMTSLRLIDICGINSTQKALSEPMHQRTNPV